MRKIVVPRFENRRITAPQALVEGDQAPEWYRISAATDDDDTTVIDIFEAIGGWFGLFAADFIRDLRDIDTANIELNLSSPGGDVFDGIDIYNALLDHPARVHVRIGALAASIASVIAMAGDEVTVAKRGMLMIHDAWGMAIGNAGDMREMADLLDKVSQNIAGVYADRAGDDADAWRERMLAETWYDADEALEAGLVDAVREERATDPDEGDDDEGDDMDARLLERPAARFDLTVFTYPGRDAAPAPSLGIAAKATTPPPDSLLTEDGGSQEHMLVGFGADTLRDALHRGVEEPFEFDADHFRDVVDLFSREAPAVVVEPEPEPEPAVSLGTTVGAAVADVVRERTRQ